MAMVWSMAPPGMSPVILIVPPRSMSLKSTRRSALDALRPPIDH
jgi:hypothetical protein